jgi:hypothetical protein
MDKINTIKLPRALPRPAPAADIARVPSRICSRWPRKDVPLDPLLFETLPEVVLGNGLAGQLKVPAESKVGTSRRPRGSRPLASASFVTGKEWPGW